MHVDYAQVCARGTATEHGHSCGSQFPAATPFGFSPPDEMVVCDFFGVTLLNVSRLFFFFCRV